MRLQLTLSVCVVADFYLQTFRFVTDLCFMFILSFHHFNRYYLYTVLCAVFSAFRLFQSIPEFPLDRFGHEIHNNSYAFFDYFRKTQELFQH